MQQKHALREMALGSDLPWQPKNRWIWFDVVRLRPIRSNWLQRRCHEFKASKKKGKCPMSPVTAAYKELLSQSFGCFANYSNAQMESGRGMLGARRLLCKWSYPNDLISQNQNPLSTLHMEWFRTRCSWNPCHVLISTHPPDFKHFIQWYPVASTCFKVRRKWDELLVVINNVATTAGRIFVDPIHWPWYRNLKHS